LTALRQLRPVCAENEPVVAIAGRREAEQVLQQPVDRGRCEKVAPAHDIAHALPRIVNNDRQMVARR
jgi:hypothetical protein